MNHVLGGARISSSTRKGTLRLSMHANGRYSRRYSQEGMELRKMRTRRSNAQFTPSDPTQENLWEAWQFCRVGSGGVNNWKSEITDAGYNIDRVITLTRCETRVFPVFEKMPKKEKRTFEMLK